MDELNNNPIEPISPIDYVLPLSSLNIIKVIGVGGGGSNAVNYMYQQGIKDVSFAVCNTDDQALRRSPVPEQILLGKDITKGLGAGSKPEVARMAAEASADEIDKMLSDKTKMVFITAGMGGGTGTGAAPVIADIAKQKGILTVGIVTIPFEFEGKQKIKQALRGVVQMSQHVDALLVINNDKLRTIYSDLKMSNAFQLADDVLTKAAKGIAEIITVDGYINVDFADVEATMKNGGVAIMNTGHGSGEKRLSKAIADALTSPLLNNHDIHNSKKILLNIYSSTTNEIQMEEITEIHEFMEKMGDDIEVIWGATFDKELGDEVKITLIATGTGMNIIPEELRVSAEAPEATATPSSEQTISQPVEVHVPHVDYHPPVQQPAQSVKRADSGPRMPFQKPPVAPEERWMKDLYPGHSNAPSENEITISLDDIDDDDLLKQWESTPAYKRR